MCFVAVYLQHPDGSVATEPAFEDVAQLECKEGEVVIGFLFAPPQTIRGRIRRADLLDSTVVIETGAQEPRDR